MFSLFNFPSNPSSKPQNIWIWKCKVTARKPAILSQKQVSTGFRSRSGASPRARLFFVCFRSTNSVCDSREKRKTTNNCMRVYVFHHFNVSFDRNRNTRRKEATDVCLCLFVYLLGCLYVCPCASVRRCAGESLADSFKSWRYSGEYRHALAIYPMYCSRCLTRHSPFRCWLFSCEDCTADIFLPEDGVLQQRFRNVGRTR